jgi:hypothetical protein
MVRCCVWAQHSTHFTVRFSVTISGTQTSFSTVCQLPHGAAQQAGAVSQQRGENNAHCRRGQQQPAWA